MAQTKIDWTDWSWNAYSGCDPVSPGCDNCYMPGMAIRQAGRNGYPMGDPTKVTFHPDKLEKPLHMRKPKKIFVNSMYDLFHEDISFEEIADIFRVMAQANWHTFQILTKRPERMLEFFNSVKRSKEGFLTHNGDSPYAYGGKGQLCGYTEWPLPNVWLGVTAENQEMADKRIPILLQTPAAVRFVSVEPMLGPVDLTDLPVPESVDDRVICHRMNALTSMDDDHFYNIHPKLDWVICGGETSRKARPCHPAWVRSLRDQCEQYGTPYFFKGWGEWTEDAEGNRYGHPGAPRAQYVDINTGSIPLGNRADMAIMWKLGKKASGRLLDGVEHSEFPKAVKPC